MELNTKSRMDWLGARVDDVSDYDILLDGQRFSAVALSPCLPFFQNEDTDSCHIPGYGLALIEYTVNLFLPVLFHPL